MATEHQSLTETIRIADEQLDRELRRRLGICVGDYRLIRLAFRAVAIGVIVLTATMPNMGLPPTGYLVLGALALGPDAVEAYLTRGE